MNYQYLSFYKKVYSPNDLEHIGKYDLIISTDTDNLRISCVAKKLKCDCLAKLCFSEYDNSIYDRQNAFSLETQEENIYIQEFLSWLTKRYKIDNLGDKLIAIDVTGFITPYLFYLILVLFNLNNVEVIDLFYTEPTQYIDGDRTVFLDGSSQLKPVKGYTMGNNPISDDMMLVLGTGYDRSVIHRINNQVNCKKHYIFGLPSTQPDMYFQNIYNVYSVDKTIADLSKERVSYASAVDPFHNASTLDSVVSKLDKQISVSLCPIGSKPQAVGFLLYYLVNLYKDQDNQHLLNIVYPYSDRHNNKCSTGISKIWQYRLDKRVIKSIHK